MYTETIHDQLTRLHEQVLALPGVDRDEVDRQLEAVLDVLGDWVNLTIDWPGLEADRQAMLAEKAKQASEVTV